MDGGLERRVKTKAADRVPYREAQKEFDALSMVIPTKDTIYWLMYQGTNYKTEASRKIFGRKQVKTVPGDYFDYLHSLRVKFDGLKLLEGQNLTDHTRELAIHLVESGAFRNKASLSAYVTEQLKDSYPQLKPGTVNETLFHARRKTVDRWLYSAYRLLEDTKNGEVNIDTRFSDSEFFAYQGLLKLTFEYLRSRHKQNKKVAYNVLSKTLGLSKTSVISHLSRKSPLNTNTFFGVDGYHDRLMVYLLNQFFITMNLRDDSRFSEEAERVDNFSKMYPNRNKVIVLLNPDASELEIKCVKKNIAGILPRRYNVRYESDTSKLRTEIGRLITPYTTSQSSRS